jgi:threonine dehydratase
LAEGGAAVGVAALIAGRVSVRGPAAVIVSGANLGLEQIAALASGAPIRVGEMLVSR